MTGRASVCLLVGTLSAGGAAAAPYAYHDYDGMVAELQALATAHPGLAELWTAQDMYGLPTIDDGGVPLSTYILRITNESLGLDKPEVLLVGTQHGDEIVSLEVLLALAKLLLESHGSHPWLTYLVDHREIFFVPMANPWGHRNGLRRSPGGEGSEDMNRDHVYDRDPCTFGCEDATALSTVGARAIHELMRRHLFRVMLDFHGGVEMIIHPWGTPLHAANTTSPDAKMHAALGQRMSDYGGTFNGAYPVGTSTDLLGAVYGPLDDTAYAATWDAANADPLWPTGGSGALSYTVEISNDKSPPASMLGGDADLLTTDGLEDGYVPKNVRIALAAIDIAEFWVDWVNRDEVPLEVEEFSLSPMPRFPTGVDLEWSLRGCFTVDTTYFAFGTNPSPLSDADVIGDSYEATSGSPCFGSPTLFTDATALEGPGFRYLSPIGAVDVIQTAAAVNPDPDISPQSWLARERREDGLIATVSVDPGEVNTIQAHSFREAEPLMIRVVPEDSIAFDDFEDGTTDAWDSQQGLLSVPPTAAFDGAFGLEVSLNGSCAHTQDLEITAPPEISGLFEACSTISAEDVSVAGGTTFRAGDAVLLNDDFSVESSGTFVGELDSSLSPFSWLEDESPAADLPFYVDFQMNLDNLTLGAGDHLVVFEAKGTSGQLLFQVVLRDGGGQKTLALRAREDDGTLVESAQVNLGAGWQQVRVSWEPGKLEDFFLGVSLTGLDNASGFVESVRWGVVGGELSSSSGTVRLDDFWSHWQ